MWDPISLTLAPSKCKSVDLLMKNREIIGKYLGIELPENPEKAWNLYTGRVGGARRYFKETCVEDKGSKLCIYKYTVNFTHLFIEMPILSAARGTVIRWYDNCEYRTMGFPFAKFFNYMETKEASVLPNSDYVVTEKLDGTLISCWEDEDGEIRCNTRGLLDVFTVQKMDGAYIPVVGRNPFVEKFFEAVDTLGLRDELEKLVKNRQTAMFELVGDIPASMATQEFDLVLRVSKRFTPYFLAVRRPDLEIDYLVDKDVGFPRAQILNVRNIEEAIETAKRFKDKEGIVIQYPGVQYRSGHEFRWWNYLIKVKSPGYVLMGKIKTGEGVNWRNIAKATVLGTADDILAIIEDEEIKEFIREVGRRYEELLPIWLKYYERLPFTEKEEKILRYTYKMGWLLPYMRYQDPEAALGKLLVDNMPKKKRAILSFMERLRRKLEKVYDAMWGG